MIAIVYPQFYGVGGIARYLDSFLANLPVDHPEIVLITGDEKREERSFRGVEIIHVPFSSNRFSLATWGLAVRRLLLEMHRSGRVRYVNLHWPPLIPALFLPSEIPLVLTAHTTYLGMAGRYYESRHFDGHWIATSLAIKMWIERKIFCRVGKVIALTEQGRQEVLRYGFAGPIAVIPNGADVRKFQPDEVVSKDVDVLFSGRIERRKGSVPMVELCRQLVAKKPGIRICIVGYGEDFDWVRSELSPLSANVVMTGKVPFDEMVAYYNRSRVYVSTSYYEGLPGTCLEAMSMQLPAVVWDFLFYRGLVIEGETGALAEPNDFSAMVDKTLALLSNPKQASQMGRNGRALLESDYSWEKLAGDILEVYKS